MTYVQLVALSVLAMFVIVAAGKLLQRAVIGA